MRHETSRYAIKTTKGPEQIPRFIRPLRFSNRYTPGIPPMKQSRRKQQDGHQDAAWGAHSIDLVFLLLALPFFLFCHAAPGAPEEAGPAAAMGSAAPSPVPDEKVVYGTDDRREVYETTDASHRAWAASTCALVSAADLTGNNNGTYTLKTTSYLYSGRPACSDEPYGRNRLRPFARVSWRETISL